MLSAAKHLLSFVESNQKRIPLPRLRDRDDSVGAFLIRVFEEGGWAHTGEERNRLRTAATASVPSTLRPHGFIGTTLDVSCGPPSSSKAVDDWKPAVRHRCTDFFRSLFTSSLPGFGTDR
jgi:hypothetical protein